MYWTPTSTSPTPLIPAINARSLFTALLAVTCGCWQGVHVCAQEISLVSPAGLADVEGNDFASGVNVNMPFHLQALHQATDFASLPAARWITAVFRRPDAVASAGTIQFDDYVLTLSTTSRSALSANFESNFGPSREVVYDGSAVFSSLNATTPAGTKAFDLGVASQKAFRYDPAAGNLLVDLRSSSGWDVPFRTDGQTTDYVSFVMNAGSSTAANANIVEHWLPVHLFTFVPEPSALLLAGPLFAAALVHHRRRRRSMARGVAATKFPRQRVCA